MVSGLPGSPPTAGVVPESSHHAILDHTSNPNFPTYWHARDYGLFAVNPLGVHGFDPKAAPLNYSLDTGQSTIFRYRILFLSSVPTPEELNAQAKTFYSER